MSDVTPFTASRSGLPLPFPLILPIDDAQRIVLLKNPRPGPNIRPPHALILHSEFSLETRIPTHSSRLVSMCSHPPMPLDSPPLTLSPSHPLQPKSRKMTKNSPSHRPKSNSSPPPPPNSTWPHSPPPNRNHATPVRSPSQTPWPAPRLPLPSAWPGF